MTSRLVHIPAGPSGTIRLEGMLELPQRATGVVVFAHGSGSSRHSPRNNYVALVLRNAGLGTLLIDLLTPQEDGDPETRFDIPRLTHRLLTATHWLQDEKDTRTLPVGYFGASTGAAAALAAAAAEGPEIAAVVSRGGRPDLAGEQALTRVPCPTLLLVGGDDQAVMVLNQQALAALRCEKKMVVVPGATHLFEEPGALEQVARHAATWLSTFMPPASARSR